MSLPDLARVRETFDGVAPDFDLVVVRNPINAWMHEVNMREVFTSFSPGSALLELGCGTGTDAVLMAERGCRVLGVDISHGMVRRAEEKAAAAGLTDRLEFIAGRSADLAELTKHSSNRPFDGAYANFTLTYEESLPKIAAGLASVLKDRTRFICTLPNRVVLSELLCYLPQLRFGKILWRLQKPLMKDVHGSLLEIHAYSVTQVRDAFASHFDLEGTVGIPTFLPPVYLHPQYRRLGGGQRLLQGLDLRLARRWPWNRLGEHTLYRFRKRQ